MEDPFPAILLRNFRFNGSIPQLLLPLTGVIRFMKGFFMTCFLSSALFSWLCPLVRTNFPSRVFHTPWPEMEEGAKCTTNALSYFIKMRKKLYHSERIATKIPAHSR
jgi:hypothetical protein